MQPCTMSQDPRPEAQGPTSLRLCTRGIIAMDFNEQWASGRGGGGCASYNYYFVFIIIAYFVAWFSFRPPFHKTYNLFEFIWWIRLIIALTYLVEISKHTGRAWVSHTYPQHNLTPNSSLVDIEHFSYPFSQSNTKGFLFLFLFSLQKIKNKIK